MKNNKQAIRSFYEKFYSIKNVDISKVERLKQSCRITLIKSLISDLNIRENKRALIAGCGFGSDVSIFDGQSIAFDLSFNAVRLVKQNFKKNRYLVADATFIPFKANSFDLIICSEVLEHIGDPEAAISEFYRILDIGGYLIITVPNWLSLFGIGRKILEFVCGHSVTANNQPVDNWYTFRQLKNQLEKKFDIQNVRGAWFFPPISWKNLNIIPDKLGYVIFCKLVSLDLYCGKKIPFFGHVIATVCKRK